MYVTKLDKDVLNSFTPNFNNTSHKINVENSAVDKSRANRFFEISDKLFNHDNSSKLLYYRNILLIVLGVCLFLSINYILPFHTSDFINIQELISVKQVQNSNDNAVEFVRTVYSRNASFETAVTPDTSASEILIFDLDSQQVFYQKNSDLTQPIASITKLMTTMVLLDSYKLEDTIVFNGDFSGNDTSLGIQDGDSMLVSDIVKSLLIASQNDVAEAVANNFKGGVDAFFAKIDEKGQVIGLENSNFRTASGLYDERNYSSASDIKKIAEVALTYQTILDVVKQGSDVVTLNHSDGSSETVTVYTTNKLLLNDSRVQGLKTGYTYGAGQCFVGYYIGADGRRLMSIVLGSNDRFSETNALVNMLGY